MDNIQGLTDKEIKVLKHLELASKEFFSLEKYHPSDNSEWVSAVHQLQCLIAYRVAKRVNPKIWT